MRSLLRFPTRFRHRRPYRQRRRRTMLLLLLLITCLLLLLPPYLIYRPPRLLIRYFQHRWPSVLWRVSTASKTIALTIDDAPSEYTTDILDILQANGARATFFVIGEQVQGREDVLRRVVEQGSELGNHAWRDEASRALSDEDLTAQIVEVRALIGTAYAAAGKPPPPQYFRPGSGFFSGRMRGVLDGLGYRLVLGSVYPHDAQISWAWLNAWHVLGMVGRGAVVVCHDRRSWTVGMLGRVVPELRRRGWRVVTVTELLEEEEREKEGG